MEARMPIALTGLLLAILPRSSGAGDLLDAWTWRHPRPTGATLTGIAHGQGVHVAISAVGTVLTSPDETNWTVRKRDTVTTVLSGVTFGNGLFAVVGSSGSIQTTTNGVTWMTRASGTVADLPAADSGPRFYRSAWAPSMSEFQRTSLSSKHLSPGGFWSLPEVHDGTDNDSCGLHFVEDAIREIPDQHPAVSAAIDWSNLGMLPHER
jgi:hypothetical protein